MPGTRLRSHAAICCAALCLAALTLAGCGAGGFDGPAAPPALRIATLRLPAAQRGADYVPTQLTASGARAPLAWSLVDGRLPSGIALDVGGVLSGRPAERGVFAFRVQAADGYDADTTELQLAVDTLAVTVQGLHFGDAWTETPISIQTVGHAGRVTYALAENESGGAFDRIDARGAWAVYVPGDASATCRDRIVATDVETGNEVEVVLHVMPHPARSHVAAFGASDVWYVDFDRRFGGHEQSSDWEHALALVGLHSGASVSTETDGLASFYVRRRVLERLNEHFGRRPDGTEGSGLDISFPMTRPDDHRETPAPGRWAAPTPDRYNVIAIAHHAESPIVGLAYRDSPSNELIENDTPSLEAGVLGVFANQLTTPFNAAYQNEQLIDRPVGRADEATLRALVYGAEIEGTRALLVRRMADGFAAAVAVVMAHEIGHSLGLPHNDYAPGSIMNNGTAVYPGARYAFLPEHLEQLAFGLPGPGRLGGQTTAALSADAPVLPEGGISPCRLCAFACRGRHEDRARTPRPMGDAPVEGRRR